MRVVGEPVVRNLNRDSLILGHVSLEPHYWKQIQEDKFDNKLKYINPDLDQKLSD